ncbi:sacsin, partial [Acrasis kona]
MLTNPYCEGYSQYEPLTKRLNNILKEYPDGTQIIRELLQNADDAGASDFSVMIDDNRTSDIQGMDGPSLICYNNAAFEDRDFESLKALGDSRKEKEKEKTGRFGIGFNSVYHLTDYPSFVSREYGVLLDPNVNVIGQLYETRDAGLRINLVESDRQNKVYELFANLEGLFGFQLENKKGFNGTLFRFPLRLVESAVSSKLHTVQTIMDMLLMFQKEAVADTMFLKNVKKIEVFQRSGDTIKKWYSMQFEFPNSKHQEIRSDVNKLLRNFNFVLNGHCSEDYNKVYEIDVVEHYCEIDGIQEEHRVSQKYVSSNYLGRDKSMEMAKEALNNKTSSKRVPFGSVSARIMEGDKFVPLQRAFAYCFLPVAPTELPVHVNSFFELSSNRRELWRASDDLIAEGKEKYMWNDVLKNDALAPAYVNLIVYLRHELKMKSSDLYQLFPTMKVGMSTEWSCLVNKFYELLADKHVNVFETVKGSFVSAKDARLALTSQEQDEKLTKAVNYIAAYVMPVCCIPQHISDAITIIKIQPEELLNALRCYDNIPEDVDEEAVLEFCCKNKYDLTGVRLLRILTGKLLVFGSNVHLVGDDLKPFISKHIDSLSDAIAYSSKMLTKIYKTKDYKLKKMKSKVFMDCLKDILDKRTYEHDASESPLSSDVVIIHDYINKLKKNRSEMYKLPIIPTYIIDENFVAHHKMSVCKQFVVRDDSLLVDYNSIKLKLQQVGLRVVRPEFNNLLEHVPKLDLTLLLDMMEAFLKQNSYDPDLHFLSLIQRKFNFENSNLIPRIKNLPIFSFYGPDQKCSVLSQGCVMPPLCVQNTNVLTNKFLCSNDLVTSKFIVDVLEVEIMPDYKFYKGYLFPAIRNGFIEIKQALADLKQALCHEQDSFFEELSDMPFVTTMSGQLNSPRNLFDREAIKNLDWLPLNSSSEYLISGDFDKYYSRLKQCNLRTTLPSDLLKTVIEQIAVHQDFNLAVKVFEYLKSLSETKLNEYCQLFANIAAHSWIPCLHNKLGSLQNTIPKDKSNLVDVLNSSNFICYS